MKAKKAKKSPLIGMNFDEAIARLAQTKPEEVKPPKGKKRKRTKGAKRSRSPVAASVSADESKYPG